MSRYYREAINGLKRLGRDRDGVVSFEYVIVAFCIVGAVTIAFNAGAGATIANTLTSALNAIGTAVTAATGG